MSMLPLLPITWAWPASHELSVLHQERSDERRCALPTYCTGKRQLENGGKSMGLEDDTLLLVVEASEFGCCKVEDQQPK
eukprot:scaffold11242_cov106-Cylindrotheca_fusiformis.AAC.5